MGGFSLVEPMLSLSLGLALSGAMLHGLVAEGQNGARFSRQLRERAAQRRTLELVKHDLAQATAVSETPELEQHGCSLAGRSAVLYLRTAAGPVTYSVGAAPSAIWRGRVLMRCGPAFGLDGLMSAGSQTLNRVVMDGLATKPQIWAGCLNRLAAAGSTAVLDLAKSSEQPFSACLDRDLDLLVVRIEQQFGTAKGERDQRMVLEQVIGFGA